MIFTRRIRSISAVRRLIRSGSPLIVGISSPERFESRLRALGFSFPLQAGEALLPSPSFGSSASLNADGWIEKHTDLPLETAFRQVIWRWKMKRGYGFEWESKLADVPYKRYPRTIHPPFAMELRVSPKTDGTLLLTLPQLELNDAIEKKFVTAVIIYLTYQQSDSSLVDEH